MTITASSKHIAKPQATAATIRFCTTVFILFLSSFIARSQDIPGPVDVNSFADLSYQRNQLNIDIPKLENRINEVSINADTTYLANSSQENKRNAEYYQKLVADIKGKQDTTGLAKATAGAEYYNAQSESLNRKLGEARLAARELTDLKKSLSDKKAQLLQIENRINQLMIPKINQQNLMFYAGIGFVVLMCLLLGTFYIVVKTDDVIRGVIFGGDSGIQFIALFSIIIAIILLGLTGILEGKELSALLGSVAGYILGKVKFTGGTPQTPTAPAPPAPVPPSAPAPLPPTAPVPAGPATLPSAPVAPAPNVHSSAAAQADAPFPDGLAPTDHPEQDAEAVG